MKKIIVYTTLFTLTLISCGDGGNKLERQYGALLQKEYAELENSDSYYQFLERYNLLLELSQEVYESDEIEISPENINGICFIPEKEFDLQIDQKVDDDVAKRPDPRPFSERVNLSKEVNAVIIGEAFFTESSSASAFEQEKDYHIMANMFEKDEYFPNRLKDTIKLYDSFCDDRILMDRVNNARFVFILKDLVSTDAEVDSENEEFTSGVYEGIVYVYDMQSEKFINSFLIGGANSEMVEGKKNSIDFSINSNLYDNINKALEQQLSEKFGLKGNIPHLYKP